MSKICFYFECYYVGGMDTFTVQLINNWSPEDELTLMVNASHSGAKYFKEKITNPRCHVEIHNMSMVSDWERNISNARLARLTHIVSFFCHAPYYIIHGYKRLHLERFDYLQIINGGYPAGISSRCIAVSWWLHTKKKCLHNFHNFTQICGLVNEIPNRLIDKLVIKSTSYFVSVSETCAESLRIRKGFQDIDNIRYIYNGIDDICCTPQFDLHKKLGLAPNVKVMMMLATYEERKGHRFIVNVFEKVKKENENTHLLFMGYGSDKEINELKEYIAGKNLKKDITLLSYQSNAMEYLALTDLLLIGSQSLESFGLTAIEAMKYKKVVLSTNTGGLKEVIANGEGGYLFDTDDENGMAERIVYLLSHDDEMNIQADRGHARYKRLFTADRVAKEYRKLLIGE